MPKKTVKAEACSCDDFSKMHKAMGANMFVFGLLVMANAIWGILSWGLFIGLMLAVGGMMKLSCCKK